MNKTKTRTGVFNRTGGMLRRSIGGRNKMNDISDSSPELSMVNVNHIIQSTLPESGTFSGAGSCLEEILDDSRASATLQEQIVSFCVKYTALEKRYAEELSTLSEIFLQFPESTPKSKASLQCVWIDIVTEFNSLAQDKLSRVGDMEENVIGRANSAAKKCSSSMLQLDDRYLAQEKRSWKGTRRKKKAPKTNNDEMQNSNRRGLGGLFKNKSFKSLEIEADMRSGQAEETEMKAETSEKILNLEQYRAREILATIVSLHDKLASPSLFSARIHQCIKRVNIAEDTLTFLEGLPRMKRQDGSETMSQRAPPQLPSSAPKKVKPFLGQEQRIPPLPVNPVAMPLKKTKSLPQHVFGVDIDELMVRQKNDFPKLQVPVILLHLLANFRQRSGYCKEGIFRASADAALIETYIAQCNSGEYELKDCNDAHLFAAIIKRWLRDLPGSLISEELYPMCISLGASSENTSESTSKFQLHTLLNQLPANSMQVLSLIIKLGRETASPDNIIKSKMSLRNLSIVLAPALLRGTSLVPAVMVARAKAEAGFIELMLRHAEIKDESPADLAYMHFL